MKYRRRSLLILCILLVLAVAGLIAWRAAAQSGVLVGEEAQMAFLRSSRAQVSDPEAAGSLDEKIAALQAQQNQRAAVPLLEKPQDPCAARPAALPTPPRPTEILVGFAVPFRPAELMPTSQWQEQVGGWWVHVYAGSRGTEMLSEADFSSMRTEGVLLVEIEGLPEIRSYTLPGASGALTLQSARGTVLTVVDEAGSLYYFDAAAEAWLDSPDQVLPARILLPTPTAIPDPCK